MTPQSGLPVLYSSIVPLSSLVHQEWRISQSTRIPWLAGQNLVPLTADEFHLAKQSYPIVFSNGETAVPLALMGLRPGMNVFVDAVGEVAREAYVPAYARRYPFMLVRLRPEDAVLSLCVDPACPFVGESAVGPSLFDGAEPSEACRKILEFCQNFEAAAERTRSFVADLERHDLLVDAQTDVRSGSDAIRSFGGFRVIEASRLGKLKGHILRQWAENGVLALIYAHLFSLEHMRILADQADPQKELVLEVEA